MKKTRVFITYFLVVLLMIVITILIHINSQKPADKQTIKNSVQSGELKADYKDVGKNERKLSSEKETISITSSSDKKT